MMGDEKEMREYRRDGTGRVTSDYEPSPEEIKIARDAICREFGNNGTDGYYIRILKAIYAARPAAKASDAEIPTAVRSFLENLAEARSEPLNSVVGYKDRASRDHFAVEIRNRARALLAAIELQKTSNHDPS